MPRPSGGKGKAVKIGCGPATVIGEPNLAVRQPTDSHFSARAEREGRGEGDDPRARKPAREPQLSLTLRRKESEEDSEPSDSVTRDWEAFFFAFLRNPFRLFPAARAGEKENFVGTTGFRIQDLGFSRRKPEGRKQKAEGSIQDSGSRIQGIARWIWRSMSLGLLLFRSMAGRTAPLPSKGLFLTPAAGPYPMCR